VLGRRLFSAAILISSMLLILYSDHWLGREQQLEKPGLLLAGLAVLAGIVIAGEFVQLFANAACPVNKSAVMLATLLSTVISIAPVFWKAYPADCVLGRFGFVFSGLVAGFVVLVVVEMVRYRAADPPSHGQVIDRLGRSLLAVFFVAMLMGFLINHRFLVSNSFGLLAIVTLILTVKLSDSTAYFAGKSLGTIKLAPSLSPGKTIQGSIGGLLGGCLGAFFCVYVVAPWIFGVTVDKSGWWVLMYGILVTLAGMCGDLAESLIKRDSNTKDSSSWLPGMGGILDVVDSLSFAAPVSFLLWI
jgi:phosphatidate cytidylyltransferase